MKKLITPVSTFLGYLFISSRAFAQENIDPCPEVNDDGANFNVLCSLKFDGQMIGNILTVAMIIGVLIALVFLIWGGIRWIMSGGDKTKVESARSTIIGAIVGLIIVFLSYLVISALLTVFGIGSINQLQLPTLITLYT
jgi:hypothetical protein